jgi:phosphopantothenoylcysteine decarboxylase/phosphopantothenate--cysteine ligase
MLAGKRILLVIAGGIAAYKCLTLIRRLRERGASVRCVLTRAGAQFVTPLSVAALSHQRVHSDLFSPAEESDIGHIRLSREVDLIVVAPATADIIARMATGLADELATAVLLAAAAPVLLAPAMNERMWLNPATQRNLAMLEERGFRRVGPEHGAFAEDESGIGRMAEPETILAAIEDRLAQGSRLAGVRALVTSGPTFEAIDPVRFIGNRSSGKQGHAIAAALAELGAQTVLVSGPTALPDPPGVAVAHIESAREMLAACEQALPVDVAVCAAAVGDWRPARRAGSKIKKNGSPPALTLAENPDILATLSKPGNRRPRIVVGFAAETEQVVVNAAAKRLRKGCDWMLANDVGPSSGTFGGDSNVIHFISEAGTETWPRLAKGQVAARLAQRIAQALRPDSQSQ